MLPARGRGRPGGVRTLTTLATIALAALAVGALAAAVWLAAERRRLRGRVDAASNELQRMQAAFGRFAPGAVVDRIVARGKPSDAERRDVTVLFADLFGFTALGETLTPEALVALLNDYFGRMSRVVEQHRGQVSKFIGDGLMAVFGAPLALDDHAVASARAALDMIEMIDLLNVERVAVGKSAIRIGIGIASGEVIAGYTGTQQRATYTCVGDTVNRAARLEALTKEANRAILVDAALREQLGERLAVESLGPVRLKGLTTPVEVYAITVARPAV